MNTPEFDALKSKYRVQEENNSFYIQEKYPLLGWGYSQSKNGKYDCVNKFPWWFHLCMYVMLFSVVFLIVSICYLSLNFITIFSFSTASSIFLIYFISAKSKDFAFECNSINSAEMTIDILVNAELKEREVKIQKQKARANKYLFTIIKTSWIRIIKQKAPKANKKYHYFFTTKQQRKEKLKKISSKLKI